jgi:hypothetical protein
MQIQSSRLSRKKDLAKKKKKRQLKEKGGSLQLSQESHERDIDSFLYRSTKSGNSDGR